MKMWTWQAPEVADALSAGHEYRSQWGRVALGGQRAYRVMAQSMRDAGLSAANSPPIWLWCDEPDAETIADRAFHVARVSDVERGLVVLTIDAPDSMPLLSSYSGWCDRLADPASRRALAPDAKLGPSDLQACLPVLRPGWVTEVTPLPATVVLTDEEAAALAS